MLRLFSKRFNTYMFHVANGFKPMVQNPWWGIAVGELTKLSENMGWGSGMYKRGDSE